MSDNGFSVFFRSISNGPYDLFDENGPFSEINWCHLAEDKRLWYYCQLSMGDPEKQHYKVKPTFVDVALLMKGDFGEKDKYTAERCEARFNVLVREEFVKHVASFNERQREGRKIYEASGYFADHLATMNVLGDGASGGGESSS